MDEDLSLSGVDTSGDIATAEPQPRAPEETPALRTKPLIRRTPTAPLPRVTNEEEWNALKEGQKYIDPDGVENTKLWRVKDEHDYARVPEGADYLTPDGEKQTKTKYESLDSTTQALFNMSTNDRERRKALNRAYPGKVKEAPGTKDLIVDDDGVLRKPRGMFDGAFGAGVAGMAFPTAGATAGGVAGGVAGSAAGGVGAVPGAAAGATLGGMGGQAINDLVLQLFGVYDRSDMEEVANLGWAALSGGAGEGAGRAISAAAPYAKDAITRGGPALLAKLAGVDLPGLKTAIQLREKDVLVPPSLWAKELPYVQIMSESFDPAFRTQNPLKQSALKHYEKTAKEILDEFGVKVEGSVSEPSAAVSSKEAGDALKNKAIRESQTADGELRTVLEDYKTAVAARSSSETSAIPQRQELLKAADNERQAAQHLIDTGFQDIERDIASALKVANAGSNSGELWTSVGNKFLALKRGVQGRYGEMLGRAEEVAGGHLPDSSGLAPTAQMFIEQLPEGFAGRYPAIIKDLRDLAGVEKVDPKTGLSTGQWIKEPVEPGWAQLHNLRTSLREDIDWYSLNAGTKNGALKFFDRQLTQVLHDPDAIPELQMASKLLREADDFYSENIKIFNAKELNAVMKGLEAGEPADPEKLLAAIVRPGQTDLTKKIMDVLGPSLAGGVRAADKDAMLRASETLAGTVERPVYDGMKFAREVLDRHQSRILQGLHGEKDAEKLLKQAQAIAALEGKIDIPVRPGDTTFDIISRARAAGEAAKEAADRDPMKVLAQEVAKAEQEHKKAVGQKIQAERSGPLGFLLNNTVGGVRAADKILANEDLLFATAQRFGESSPEFNALRQVYLERLFTGTSDPAKKLEKISPDMQQLMFRGSAKQIQVLAEEMTALWSSRMSRDTAKSMAATAKVTNPPLGSIRGALKRVPIVGHGTDAVARSILTKYYATVTSLANNLTFMRMLERGMKGDDAAKAAVREQLQRVMQFGGMVGAGAGESLHALPSQPNQDQP